MAEHLADHGQRLAAYCPATSLAAENAAPRRERADAGARADGEPRGAVIRRAASRRRVCYGRVDMMNKGLAVVLGALVPLVGVGVMVLLTHQPTVMPGDISSPKLAAMFNQAIDEFERDLLSPAIHPGYHDGAAASGRAWLEQVDQAESYCVRSGRFSRTAADIRLRDGQVLAERTVDTTSCTAAGTIEMRVRFAAGRVVDVQTDGSELQGTPDSARRAVQALLLEVVQVDMDTNQVGYFRSAVEKKPSLADQWAAVPSAP